MLCSSIATNKNVIIDIISLLSNMRAYTPISLFIDYTLLAKTNTKLVDCYLYI